VLARIGGLAMPPTDLVQAPIQAIESKAFVMSHSSLLPSPG
jgi:hypothetical protein